MSFSAAAAAWSPPLPRHHRLFRGGSGSGGTSYSRALVVDWDVERKNQRRRRVRRGQRLTTTTATTTRCWRRAPTASAASAAAAADDDDDVGPLVKEHVKDRDLDAVAAEAWAATVIVAPYVTGISKLLAWRWHTSGIHQQPSPSSHLFPFHVCVLCVYLYLYIIFLSHLDSTVASSARGESTTKAKDYTSVGYVQTIYSSLSLTHPRADYLFIFITHPPSCRLFIHLSLHPPTC